MVLLSLLLKLLFGPLASFGPTQLVLRIGPLREGLEPWFKSVDAGIVVGISEVEKLTSFGIEFLNFDLKLKR